MGDLGLDREGWRVEARAGVADVGFGAEAVSIVKREDRERRRSKLLAVAAAAGLPDEELLALMVGTNR